MSDQITRATMFDALVADCPSLAGDWAKFRAAFPDLPKDMPSYIFMSDLVKRCSALLRDGKDYELTRIFQHVEDWVKSDDTYVRDAAVVGFIEDLQNANLHTDTKPEDFIRFLGPKSKVFWQKVDALWTKGEIIGDDRKDR